MGGTINQILPDAVDLINFLVHVEKCMDLSHPGLIEALEQETKILEKRVIACKSHALLVTVYLTPPKLDFDWSILSKTRSLIG